MFYETLESHHPNKFKDSESPFFLSVNQNWEKPMFGTRRHHVGKTSSGNFSQKQLKGLPPQDQKVANHSV